jgi:hypothetical protein
MNRTPNAVPAESAPQAETSQAGLPNFLHVSHTSPVALEAYLHLYVDGIARTERELAASPRSA